jgi:hypothetical protein
MNAKLIFTDEELRLQIKFDKSPSDIENATRVGYDIENALGTIFYVETLRSQLWEFYVQYIESGYKYWHCYMCEGVARIGDNEHSPKAWIKHGLSREQIFKLHPKMSSIVCPTCWPTYSKILEKRKKNILD